MKDFKVVESMEKVETRSENAHNVILSCNGSTFYVSAVRVHLCKADAKYKATFCAKEAKDGSMKDLSMEIPQNLYEVLVKYAQLNNPELILLLEVERGEFKWDFTSKTWFKLYARSDSFQRYVV